MVRAAAVKEAAKTEAAAKEAVEMGAAG